MKRKLGIMACCLEGAPEIETLDLIKDVGFECFFTGFENNTRHILDMKEKGSKLGLEYPFIHGPANRVNTLWEPGVGYYPLFESIKNCIDAAASAEVPVVVLHVSSGWFPPHVSDVGLERFDRIVEYAIKKGVVVALENIRKLGNLACLMDRYEKVPEVGFCYDNGHEHCYLETVPYLDLYGTRTVCTHLHDNHGRDKNDYWGDADEHLAPFDGTFDFTAMMRRLDKYDYKGALTLELSNHSYKHMKHEEFLKMAFERLQRISEL